jgi:hypothetical protein
LRRGGKTDVPRIKQAGCKYRSGGAGGHRNRAVRPGGVPDAPASSVPSSSSGVKGARAEDERVEVTGQPPPGFVPPSTPTLDAGQPNPIQRRAPAEKPDLESLPEDAVEPVDQPTYIKQSVNVEVLTSSLQTPT